MAFLQLGGEAGAKPTYFEVYAADKLVPTLKAAVIYSLSVLGQSRTWLLRALAYEDEVFALISLFLERHSLATLHATFAESLYGLKRQPATASHHTPGGAGSSSSSSGGGGRPAAAAAAAAAEAARAAAGVGQPRQPPVLLLGQRQQRQALLCQVLLPYIKTKLDGWYAHYSRHYSSSSNGVLGLALTANAARQQHTGDAGAGAAGNSRGPGHHHRLLLRLRELLRRATAVLQRYGVRALVLLYPYLHAAIEAVRFVYQLGYLLDVFDCHSPVLQLLGQRLVRLSGTEMAELERLKQLRRQQQLAAAAAVRPRPAAALARAWVRCSSLLTDHLRSVLLLSVFGFKVLEWWYTSAEERLAAAAALPPPPPPPAPCPHPKGVPLPSDAHKCPLCRQRRANPATLAVSGYVFCYPCLFRHVSAAHCCPVTRAPATLDHIRKLYEAM